jgi:hypothetical protein
MHLQKEFDDKGNKVDFTINFINKFYDLPMFTVKRALKLSEVERVSLPSCFFFGYSMVSLYSLYLATGTIWCTCKGQTGISQRTRKT